jgi:hypothetical protein
MNNYTMPGIICLIKTPVGSIVTGGETPGGLEK